MQATDEFGLALFSAPARMDTDLQRWAEARLRQILGVDDCTEIAAYLMSMDEESMKQYASDLLGTSKPAQDFVRNLAARIRTTQVCAAAGGPSGRRCGAHERQP